MKELKTLKDIEGGMDEFYNIFYKNLKAEAVKWVKEISEKNPNPYGDSDTIYWIKHFFNLTEEDLKNNKNKQGESK